MYVEYKRSYWLRKGCWKEEKKTKKSWSVQKWKCWDELEQQRVEGQSGQRGRVTKLVSHRKLSGCTVFRLEEAALIMVSKTMMSPYFTSQHLLGTSGWKQQITPILSALHHLHNSNKLNAELKFTVINYTNKASFKSAVWVSYHTWRQGKYYTLLML